MRELRAFLFGRFHVEYGAQPLTNLQAYKAQELFCYLLIHNDTPHHREKLANLFWQDVSTEQARSYLRKAIWQLQSALDTQTNSKCNSMVQVESDWIELNPDVDLWVDALDFEGTFNIVQHIPGQELDYPDVQNINKVVNLYKGDLLDGRYEDWCLYERERFKLMLLILLDKLLAYCESHGDYETGLLYGTRILRYDKTRERAHRALMRLYYRLGHRIEALRQYDRCATILQQELAVEPSKRTKRLYEQIKTEQFTTLMALDRMTRRTKPQVIASLLNQVIEHFDEAHQALVDIQSLMQENVETSSNGRTRNA